MFLFICLVDQSLLASLEDSETFILDEIQPINEINGDKQFVIETVKLPKTDYKVDLL